MADPPDHEITLARKRAAVMSSATKNIKRYKLHAHSVPIEIYSGIALFP